MKDLRTQGYTLIELLLYIAILGSLLISVSLYFALTADSRIKNQTVSEVNQQGTFVLDTILHTIRNADAITTPAIGTTGASLSLTVPTPALSPTIFNTNGSGGSTVLGYNVDGTNTDSDSSNNVDAVKFTATATGTISTLYARIATVAASPNNKGQMAIYSGSVSPTALLASSAGVTLTPNAWNAFPISSVSVTSGQVYWLAYNANGLTSTDNDLRYHAGSVGQARYIVQAYGAWPASWTGNVQNLEFSMYGMIDTPAVAGDMQIKKGTSAVVPLSNTNVEITNLTFKNLSRASTPGVVQVSFTMSRLNPSNKNEYDFQKTFTGTAAVRQ